MGKEKKFKDSSKFKKFPRIRDKYTEHIENIPSQERRKLEYFWVAETTDGDTIPQFTVDGEENKYTQVRKLAEENRVEAVYWVPINDEPAKHSIGMTDLKNDDFEIFRRGYKQVTRSGRRQLGPDNRVYVMMRNGEHCFVSEEGRKIVTENRGHDMKEYLRGGNANAGN